MTNPLRLSRGFHRVRQLKRLFPKRARGAVTVAQGALKVWMAHTRVVPGSTPEVGPEADRSSRGADAAVA